MAPGNKGSRFFEESQAQGHRENKLMAGTARTSLHVFQRLEISWRIGFKQIEHWPRLPVDTSVDFDYHSEGVIMGDQISQDNVS